MIMEEVLSYPIIDDSRAFDGKPLSFATRSLDGNLYVKGSGHEFNHGGKDLTLEAYRKLMESKGCKIRLVTHDTFNKLCDALCEQLKTEPQSIHRDHYENARRIPFPLKWCHFGNVEIFHTPERILGNLVTWYACVNDRCYQFVDDAELNPKAVKTRLLEVDAAPIKTF